MKILIAAGGSGGHIFPALALAGELSKIERTEIVFVASNRKLDKKILTGKPFRNIFLSINPMPHRFSFKIIPFIVKFIYDLILCIVILTKEKPKVAVGFGGYTAGTIVILAAILGIKTIIHEQNLMPGRANKILDRFVNKVVVSFEESKNYFKNANVVYTGNPIREMSVVHNSRKTLEFDRGRFTILVMGGSQGAHSLNVLTSMAIKQLMADIKKDIQVIHLTGVKDFNEISNFYKENEIYAKTFSFVDDIYLLYAVSNLAISRSGASAIFELSSCGIPMILIPYPFKMNNQRFNAKYFAEKGAAIYREEDVLNSETLKDLIEGIICNRDRLIKISCAAKKLSCPDAAKNIAREVVSVV